MEPIFQFALELPPRGSRDLIRSLHAQLRAAMLDGRLKPGLRLPATRAFAAALGVSRNTASAVYDLLLSEGYLEARQGAGTYVAASLPAARSPTPMRPGPMAHIELPAVVQDGADFSAPDAAGSAPFDFRLGLPDLRLFPFDVWRRLSARALRAFARAPTAYGEVDGRAGLRAAIARHVSFARAVACRAEDVVVTAGAQQAFDLLARILVRPGETIVAVEDPGYPPLRAAFAAAGAKLVPVPVDEEGLRIDRLPAGARVVCVSPSHQFPLGTAMSLRRRSALLDYARRERAVLIEDDYDGEFRYAGRPLDALQTLDRDGMVFYVGTFSKSLFPALRLGFIIAPPWVRSMLVAAKQVADWHCPAIAQDTLGAFIDGGHLARHVRRMRRIYAARRTALMAALERHCRGRLRVLPAEAGLHLAAELTGRAAASELALAAGEVGLALQSLDPYFLAAPDRAGLVFGYGMIDAERIEPAIERLAHAMR